MSRVVEYVSPVRAAIGENDYPSDSSRATDGCGALQCRPGIC